MEFGPRRTSLIRFPAAPCDWLRDAFHLVYGHRNYHVDTDSDAHCARARAAGFEILAEPETQFYGDRTYRCRDPEGHIWTVGQTVQAVSREEAEAITGLKIEGWI